jgi:S1-C subfamily serine protease
MTALEPPAGPPPAPRYRNPRRFPMVAAFIFLGSITAGAAAGVVVMASTRVTPASTSTLLPQSSAASAIPTPSGSAIAGSTTAIAAKVDAAVVDITTTLASQAGTAKGTGIVLTSNGEVITNNHVISGAASVTVQIAGAGPSYTATVVGYDAVDDIAVLQIQGVSGLKTVTTADSSALTVGQPVLAIGNALGAGGTPTVTSGQITALQQTITASDPVGGTSETLTGLIQMNALIQPGDSGGPLVDASGNVIGIDTAGATNGRVQINAGSTTGYAIPINAALSIAQQIESGGGANITVGTRAILGVQVRDTNSGATVVGVQTASPAEAAGLQAGDVIVGVGGHAVTSTASLQTALSGTHPGDTVQVVWRDTAGQQHTAMVQLAAGPPA